MGKRVPAWLSTACIIIGFFMMIAFMIGYTTWAIDQANHGWCATLDLIDTAAAPAGNPATNPSRKYLQDLHADFIKRAHDFGCIP